MGKSLEVKLLGLDTIKKNIKLLQSKFIPYVDKSLSQSCDIFRDDSINYLKSNSKYPMSQTWNYPIRLPENWEKVKIDGNTYQLTSKSEHSAIVNYGGLGEIYAKDYGLKAFPLQLSQNNTPVAYASKVKLQSPNPFGTSTFNNPTTHQKIIDCFQNNWYRDVIGVLK